MDNFTAYIPGERAGCHSPYETFFPRSNELVGLLLVYTISDSDPQIFSILERRSHPTTLLLEQAPRLNTTNRCLVQAGWIRYTPELSADCLNAWVTSYGQHRTV